MFLSKTYPEFFFEKKKYILGHLVVPDYFAKLCLLSENVSDLVPIDPIIHCGKKATNNSIKEISFP